MGLAFLGLGHFPVLELKGDRWILYDRALEDWKPNTHGWMHSYSLRTFSIIHEELKNKKWTLRNRLDKIIGLETPHELFYPEKLYGEDAKAFHILVGYGRAVFAEALQTWMHPKGYTVVDIG